MSADTHHDATALDAFLRERAPRVALRERLAPRLYRVEVAGASGALAVTASEADAAFARANCARFAAAGFPCAARVDDLGAFDAAPALLCYPLAGAPVAQPDPHHCAQIGTVLARLHELGAAVTPVRTDPLDVPALKRHADALAGEDLARTRALLREQSLYRFPDLPHGLVHGAPDRAHLWFQGEAVSALVGFDRGGRAPLLLDLALAANAWCREPDGALALTRTRALLASYDAQRPLTALERGAWPMLLRRAAAHAWLADYHAFTSHELDAMRARLFGAEEGEGELRAAWPAQCAPHQGAA